jgi:hypothetical protein
VIKEIYYSPNCAVKLMDVAIRFMAAGTKLFEYKNGNTKNLIAEESSASRSLMHDAWIALEVNPKIQNVEDLLIYIDWKISQQPSSYQMECGAV